MKGIILLIATCCLPALLSGQPKFLKKADMALQRILEAGQSTEFIIVMRDQADISQAFALQSKDEKAHYVFNLLYDHARIRQAELIRLLKDHEIPHQPMFVANIIKAEGNIATVMMIAERDDVSRILSNEAVAFEQPAVDTGVPGQRAVEWGIERINADDVWALGFRGQGVVVGGEDTGYQWYHPAIKKQYRGFIQEPDSADHNYNWHDAIHRIDTNNVDSINPCGLDVLEPCDDGGHGTHTMGTMVGLDDENQIGVAPEAQWCGCRNMERGWGTPFTYIECFQWFLGPTDLNNENPDPSRAPHVINNSWSCPEREGCNASNWEVMNLVINNLKAAGIVVVVSAGNTGSACGTVSAPAAMFEGSFSVGATAFNDTIAGFSSRGPVVVDSSFRLKPNVSAPGVGIRSATLDGGYGHSSGTSMAGPHVAGLVALMISANPELAGNVELIETIIEQTSVPKTTDQSCGGLSGMNVPNHTYGYGRVDALAAVEAALQLVVNTEDDGSQFQPSIYPNPFVDEVIINPGHMDDEPVIRVWDLQGRMFDIPVTKGRQYYKLNFSLVPAGIYFCHIVTSEKTFVGKMMKL